MPANRYKEFLGDAEDEFLIESLEQVDELIDRARKSLDKKLVTAKNQPKAEVTIFRSLVAQRLDLLTQAGLTPKARKQIGKPVTRTESPEAELDEFLDSGTERVDT